MPPSRAELQEVLKQRDEKLAEAQNAQAELIRKQCELDDAKRAMDLTIEKQVQESLGVVRDKAKLGRKESELAAQLRRVIPRRFAVYARRVSARIVHDVTFPKLFIYIPDLRC